ncbi:MAG: heavy-metal-associated domain-containing protein [Acidobacteriota bacterium]
MVLRRDFSGKSKDNPKERGGAMQEATLEIEGMSCSHCVQAVEQALRSLPGVEVRWVEVGRAAVAYDPETVRPSQIVAAVEEVGFQVP